MTPSSCASSKRASACTSAKALLKLGAGPTVHAASAVAQNTTRRAPTCLGARRLGSCSLLTPLGLLRACRLPVAGVLLAGLQCGTQLCNASHFRHTRCECVLDVVALAIFLGHFLLLLALVDRLLIHLPALGALHRPVLRQVRHTQAATLQVRQGLPAVTRSGRGICRPLLLEVFVAQPEASRSGDWLSAVADLFPLCFRHPCEPPSCLLRSVALARFVLPAVRAPAGSASSAVYGCPTKHIDNHINIIYIVRHAR